MSSGRDTPPRSRARRLGTGLVVVAVAAGLLWTTRDPAPDGVPPDDDAAATAPAALPTVQTTAPFQQAPAKESESRLALAPSVLPQRFDPLTAGGQPPQSMVALIQRADDAEAPVLVVDDGGRVSRLPVTLGPVRDSTGPRSPLGTRSLAPSGTRAAFPQDGFVRVFYLRGGVEGHRLPGSNNEVAWNGGDSVAVASDAGTSSIQVRTAEGLSGAVTALRDPLRDTAFGEEGAVHLSPPLGGGLLERAPAAFSQSFGSREVKRVLPVVRRWYGAGHVGGRLVARSAVIDTPFTAPSSSGVFVLDVLTGEVVKALRFDGPGRTPLCCEVVGWTGDSSLVVTSRGAGGAFSLLLWDLGSGSVRRLMDSPVPLVVSLASEAALLTD